MNEHMKEVFQDVKIIQSSMKISISSCLYQILMVDMIQELSKMQVNEFQLQKSSFNFRENILQLFEETLIQSELKGLKLEMQIEPDVPK